MPLSAWSNTLFSPHCVCPEAVNKSVITQQPSGLMEKLLTAETMDGGTAGEGWRAGTARGGVGVNSSYNEPVSLSRWRQVGN